MTGRRVETQWREAARWWIDEGSRDPVYEETIHPLLRRLLAGREPEGPILDLGCGEGSVSQALGLSDVIGVDVTAELLSVAADRMPVVRARLPHLDWVRTGSVAGGYAVFVIEHLVDVDGFFASAAHAIAEGGFLIVVSNHPAYTAPGAGPLIDMSDGEVLWRWGPYFSTGVAHEPAGEDTVIFHHRTLASLLNSAASCGWALEELIEAPLAPEAIARDPGLAGQDHLPRLVAGRWRNRPDHLA